MTSVVLGAGGERVVAWEVGVLAGLADECLDLRKAKTILGTSAGALVAARLATGIDPRTDAATHAARRPGAAQHPSSFFAKLGEAWETFGGSVTERRQALGAFAVKHSPGGEDEFVARTAALLPAGRWPRALRIVAIDAESGERVAFDRRSGVPLARAVAASRAIPGLLPPVTIGDRRFVDGALGSATNADLVDEYAIVIVPLPPRATNAVEALWLEALRTEVREGLVIDAGPADVAAMGPDPMSGASAPLAVAAGYARAAQISPRRAA
ncbi:patatin-like phospholipase family protein [Solirubrobacter phytolaccae]|uniref:Patatin-like phospholipase family protein n=1 Tax=Solirubrobacter phytolaccae TaxID=1404360 RepID=A0A9X3SHY2_9ACTN|nr:patatin-like phospholipase family protein [Solirubrobacter phytolaccae]MDA0183617.1 patatin-like phospholipase family protein [Solirubrobacter phytolaccae]